MDQTDTAQDGLDRRSRPLAAAGALIRDDVGNILMIEPTYKESLELPGGYIETGEHPAEACLREVREELGIDIELGGLLVVDWAPAPSEGDKILFVFDGGVLTAAQEVAIVIGADEVKSFSYYPLHTIEARTPARLSRRIARAVEATSTRYLENGSLWEAVA
ncbi:NUDIX hydrolase [Glycomyces sp. NPDC047010]|uniref:NUDIX hydrolase n=1 Tax=Glycomyces sp. NPDC047010 TaxID=3155023 RepID=UPI0033BFCB6A